MVLWCTIHCVNCECSLLSVLCWCALSPARTDKLEDTDPSGQNWIALNDAQ